MRKLFVLLVLIALFLGSCKKNQPDLVQNGCYFQYEYVNYAWVYQHSGFTITPEGEVYTFDKSTPWVFADNDKLTLEAFKKNIESSIKMDTLINATDIERYQQLANSAITGKISDPVYMGADGGAAIYKLIVPISSVSQIGYKEVILSERGDAERNNLSPEAAVITAWMSKLRLP